MKNMKIVIVTLMAAALVLAQGKDSKPGKDPAGIPKGATQVEPNLYRATDEHGKTWFYRQSPFGISKWEDKPEVQRVVAEPLTTVHDLGDKVEFQRQTPFGVSKWVTKKTDLSVEEKELLAADEAQRAAAAEAGKTAPVDKSREKQEKQ
jgi:hypothetical protein